MDPTDTLTGIVFNIQRFCTHDGPGIRTTVFVKGCPPVGSEILNAITGTPTLPEDDGDPPK